MTETPRRITILGSTGSIGRNALELVRAYPGQFEVLGLAAHSNAALLAEQIAVFSPAFACIGDPRAAADLRSQFSKVQILDGAQGMETLAAVPVDTVLCAVVGAVGLRPLLAAIRAGNRVAVANKEPLVMAGHLIMEEASRHGVRVLPVDSEHNAIFQCMEGNRPEDVHSVHLTASGGPFYGRSRDSLRHITPEQAVRHPTWDMGAKISVDSATLMNKGLEIVEAMWLFSLPSSKINVVIHPQSLVHSLVEFHDGHILAHLGVTDMKFPILFALTWPERLGPPLRRLDLTAMPALTFAAPDFEEFPCLRLARAAAEEGGTATAILNAANEEAVNAFCARRIPFLAISEVVAATREKVVAMKDYSLEAVLAADAEARAKAKENMAHYA